MTPTVVDEDRLPGPSRVQVTPRPLESAETEALSGTDWPGSQNCCALGAIRTEPEVLEVPLQPARSVRARAEIEA
jgi:hypothetical protein